MASDNNLPNFPPPLTPSQWITFYSLSSVIYPALSPEEIDSILAEALPGLSRDHIKALALNDSNYTNPQFRSCLEAFLTTRLPPGVAKKLGVVLDLLNSIPGCLLLTYSTTAFHLQPIKARQEIILSWLNPQSSVLFPPIRTFVKTIITITSVVWSQAIPTDVLHGALGYIEKTGRSPEDDAYEQVMEDDKRGFYKFDFLDLGSACTEAEGEREVQELEYDVVIVGSGCGGSVVAARLAKEGYKVVVVEKGVWYPTDQLPLSENQAARHLFENNMAWPSEDVSIVVLAGTTFGGGGVINWSACLQTPGYVREEWATNGDLPYFLSKDYQDCLDFVWERMGVSNKTDHNHRNLTILEGSRKLGYHAMVVPQNTGAALDGEEDLNPRDWMHSDSYCTFGCGCREKGEGRKMGTTQTWLPDAAKAGAKFIQDFYVERVLFSDDTKSKAIGVEGFWGKKKYGNHGTRVVIKAKKVVISSGALHSPAVLLRSGLTNPNIGKNLYLHPVCVVTGFFDTPTSPWVGSALTTVCTQFENLDGEGHGCRIETAVMPPLAWMRPLPFHSPLQLKKHILNYRRAGSFIVLHKEKYPGSVFCDSKTGLPRIRYTPSEYDRALLVKGIVATAKILYIQGVEEIVTQIVGMPTFKRHPTAEELAAEKAEEGEELENFLGKLFWTENMQMPTWEGEEEENEFEDPGINDKRFQRWLKKLENYGLPLPQANFVSAHQMGTNRMGSDPALSVVDQRGHVWGVDGLYVADTSVFPSASGVNPMISCMAICHWIAGGLVKELRNESKS